MSGVSDSTEPFNWDDLTFLCLSVDHSRTWTAITEGSLPHLVRTRETVKWYISEEHFLEKES